MKKDEIKDFCKVAAMIICVGFTFCVIVIAGISKGGLLCYYEPNIYICITEIVIGVFGIVVLSSMIYEIISK